MMEININIEDYLSKEEIKEIAKEQISYAIKEKFRKESDIERIITNLSYEFLFKAVSETIGKDSLLCDSLSKQLFGKWKENI